MLSTTCSRRRISSATLPLSNSRNKVKFERITFIILYVPTRPTKPFVPTSSAMNASSTHLAHLNRMDPPLPETLPSRIDHGDDEWQLNVVNASFSPALAKLTLFIHSENNCLGFMGCSSIFFAQLSASFSRFFGVTHLPAFATTFRRFGLLRKSISL